MSQPVTFDVFQGGTLQDDDVLFGNKFESEKANRGCCRVGH
jgi:hypothetical protein